MDQADLQLQLKVWKDLAISKQILIRAATDALKLEPDTSADNLKQALEGVIKKNARADAEIANAQQQAKLAIAEIERKLSASQQAQAQAQTAAAESQAKLEEMTRQMATERATLAKELQKWKDKVTEKEKALKAVNVALADTPENVLKKMNAFKKQKQEEADARRQIETALNTLRAEKRKQDQQLADLQKNTAKLITQHRELHELSLKMQEQLKSLAEAKDVPTVPELDTKLIEEIEQPKPNGIKAKPVPEERAVAS